MCELYKSFSFNLTDTFKFIGSHLSPRFASIPTADTHFYVDLTTSENIEFLKEVK